MDLSFWAISVSATPNPRIDAAEQPVD